MVDLFDVTSLLLDPRAADCELIPMPRNTILIY